MPRDGILCLWEGYAAHPGQHRQGMAELGFKPTGTEPAATHTLILGHYSARLHSSLEDYKGFSLQAEGPGSGKALHAHEGKHACGHQLLRTHAGTHMFTRMHTRKAVPVTSFLGDSAQLDNHTSESQREQGEAGEKTVRQTGRQEGRGCRGCRH